MSTQGTSEVRTHSLIRTGIDLGSMRISGSMRDIITRCLEGNNLPFSHGTLLIWTYGIRKIQEYTNLIGNLLPGDIFLGTFLFYFWEKQGSTERDTIVTASKNIMSSEAEKKQAGGIFFIDFLLQKITNGDGLYQEYIHLIYSCIELLSDDMLSEMTFYNREMKKPASLLEIVQYYDETEAAPNDHQGKIGKFSDLRKFLEKKCIPPYIETPLKAYQAPPPSKIPNTYA